MTSFFQRLRQRFKSTSDADNQNQVENIEQPIQNPAILAIENSSRENLESRESIRENEEEVVDETPNPTIQEEQMEIRPSTSQNEPLDQLPFEEQFTNEQKATNENLNEEVASTIPDEPHPSKWRDDLYIQTRKNFQRTTKEAFALNQFMAEMMPISMETQHYRSVNTAIFIQNVFHNVALILQGFLSGFALFHTIMAFAFMDVVSLVKGYQYMATPMHAVFYFCFVVSAIDAMDRFETGGTWKETLSRWIGLQKGGLGLFIAVAGTCITVVMTKFEEYLATNLSSNNIPQDSSISAWHWLSAARAVCAVSGWLLIALQPSTNYTRDQLIAMAPDHRNNENFGDTNISSENSRIANARVISSLANSVARLDRLDLSQDFLTSIKVLAAHQATTNN